MFNPTSCDYPWTELQVNYDGTFGCCCYHIPFPKEGRDNLDELWNSSELKNMRKNIASYDIRDSICHTCSLHEISKGNTGFILSNPDFLSEKQRENEISAKNSFDEKEEIVRHYPRRLYLNFGLICNLDCIMCSQMKLREEHKEILRPDFLYRQPDFLSHVTEITLIGGEIFAMPSALEFLRFVSGNESLRKHTQFRIVTNGVLVDRHIELLEKFDRIALSFSIDSSGESYESIRRGAKWGKVTKNVEMINEMCTNRPGWRPPSVGCVLMKSGLPGLLGLCEWVIDKKLSIGFSPVFDFGYEVLKKENIFKYPESLESLPGWRDIFRDCISLLYRSGYQGAADSLLWYRTEIPLATSTKFDTTPRPVRRATTLDKLKQLLRLCIPHRRKSSGIDNDGTES